MNAAQIKAQALAEIRAEDYRKAVDEYKVKLRAGRWWHRLLPFRIVIIRREKWT